MKNIFLFHIPIKMFLTFQPKNIKLCIKEFNIYILLELWRNRFDFNQTEETSK